MCGISGFVSKQNITSRELKAMNDTMIHRGPDDEGVEIYPMKGTMSGYNIGLAQRRLAIIDLTPGGHQPMSSVDGRITVVFNGEIYNYREIKEELKDYPFKSDSDTEVIIASYLKWGIDAVARFNGMFAICLYDRDTEDVYLCRDRIGKKPLYYELDGENLYFASELKPLMARPGFGKQIRTQVLSRYLCQLCVNAPDSIFENVYKLEPGSILKFANGKAQTWKYWDVWETYSKMRLNPVTDYAQAKEELKNLLRRSVSLRMISDVPLGTFLSGGYDSSLVTAIARECAQAPVKTFSIGFNEEKYNEAKYAKQVAEYLGTDHTELYIDENMMFDLVDSIPKYYDEPFADSSQIPSMLVSGLARSKVTVALSGDGGDEFFCGYNVYELIAQAQKLDALGGMVSTFTSLPLLRGLKLGDKLPFKVKVIADNRNKSTKTQFGSQNYTDIAKKMVLGDTLSCKYEFDDKYKVKSWQTRRMLLDMDTYLPGDILCKMDRASMKYSLESRCPILDVDVMEYSFRLDHSFKYDKGNKKRILKDIAYDYIPREMLDRPKVGFGVPLDKWLRGPLKDKLLDMTDRDFLVRQGIFEPDVTVKFVKDYLENGDSGQFSGSNYSKICWPLFVFQQWYLEYMR